MQRIYTSAIIGAGNIAANYDGPDDSMVLTHAHAMKSCDRLNFLGFYDVQLDRAEQAARKWGVEAFSTMDALMARGVDMLVIAAPNVEHDALLRAVIGYTRLVLCEKPLTTDYAGSLDIVTAYQQRNIPLAVNYQRRYDPTVCDLKEKAERSELGAFLGGSVLYSKGIKHNGSHAVDLLRYIFGEVTGLTATGHVYDHSKTDPTVSGIIFLHDKQVHLIAGNENDFSMFEIDLIFQRGRYRFVQSGLSVERYEVNDDPVFAGYREMVPVAREQTGLGQALSLMARDLVAHLDGAKELRIAASGVLNTQYVCERLADAPLHQHIRLE